MHLPRLGLWSNTVKQREEFCVREVETPGCMVRQRVTNALEVEDRRLVAVGALVEAGFTEEVRRRAGSRHRAPVPPGNSRGVIAARAHCALAAIDSMYRDVVVTDGACEFQVRIGYIANGVVG